MTSLLIREMLVKSIVGYQLILIRLAKTYKTNSTKYWKKNVDS